MVVNMMKWRPWPPNFSKRFQVNLTVHCLEGFWPLADHVGAERVMVDVKWKGPKGKLGSRFRRSLKRGRTTDKLATESGIITWDEDFDHECVLATKRKATFQPWVVHFVVLRALQQGAKVRLSVGGTAIMNLAEFISLTEITRQTTKIHVSRFAGLDAESVLVITVNFVELRTSHEGSDSVCRIISPSLPCIGGTNIFHGEGNEQDQPWGENGERNLDTVKGHAGVANGKKNSGELYMSDDGKLSPRSAESSHESGDLFDSDSVDDYDDELLADGLDHSFRKTFSYGTLAGANLFVEGALPFYRGDREHDNLAQNVLSIHSMAAAEAIPKLAGEGPISDSDQTTVQPTMRSLLSWRKRKLSFRSPRARGQPLLNKAYGEDGGDDIDYDRRQSGSPIELLHTLQRENVDNPLSPPVAGYLDFGDEHFSVGSWEKRELVSRDGQMKLSANAFFASIDQRSERAAGGSACTALVAVIADWLHQNPTRMPIRAEFDTLIREGSAEWRKLCEIEAYKDRFPDQHFDLDTVLQAELRPLVVDPERSFIGFFQPEGLVDSCDFLQGAMSFENIWDEIWEEVVNVMPKENFEPAVYIVSWNDHFFVLKVEYDAYYLIDTLGERLFEGCNQAYILQFDEDAILCHIPKVQVANGEKSVVSGSLVGTVDLPSGSSCQQADSAHEHTKPEEINLQQEQNVKDGEKNNTDSPVENAVYKGKEACRQFVKGFFAALPLRELQTDIKRGLMGKVPLHRHLQIEFHYTSLRPMRR
eukprot:c29292_g1_i1 orf=850-3129(+)